MADSVAAAPVAAVARRNLRGTAAEEFGQWPSQSFEDMQSTLCVQQYVQQCVYEDAENVQKILEAPPNTDERVWQAEHVRQFVLELNHLVAVLGPYCTKESCPAMESEGQRFLCAAHNPPAECCAIDYMTHTIDVATKFLHSTQHFPGRMDVPAKTAEQFPSQIRRLYRLFLHAYSAHRDVFKEFESSKWLCKRFSVFAKQYKFLDEQALTVPVDWVKEEEQQEGEGEGDENEGEDGEETEEEGGESSGGEE